jgi:hypothetical protein
MILSFDSVAQRSSSRCYFLQFCQHNVVAGVANLSDFPINVVYITLTSRDADTGRMTFTLSEKNIKLGKDPCLP